MGFDKMLVAIAVVASVNFFVAEALAQKPPAPRATGQQKSTRSGVETPPPGVEKRVEGQVQSVDASGTEITLTDGTTLTIPLGAAIRPGVLEGFTVVASYREENGRKVLTRIALKEPAASPPTTPTAPPRESPPR